MHGVEDAFAWDVGLGQAQLLALVEVDRAGQGQGQQGRRPGPAGAQAQVGGGAEGLGREVEGGVRTAVAGDGPGDVVVAQDPGGGRPDRGVFGEGGVDDGAQSLRLPGAGEEVEVERGVQFVGAEVAGEALRVGQPDLTDEHGAVLVGDRPPGAVDVVQFVQVDVRVGVDALLEAGEGGVLGEQGRGVDAYARDAAFEPEAQDVLVFPADFGVRPVQIGLLGGEQVEVPLAVRHSGPGGAGELRRPVVGREFAVLAAARAEVEAGALGAAGARRQGVLEPGVPVGDVVGHDVDDDADAERGGFGDQLLGLVEGAEGRVDGTVVGDVIAAVDHRGGVPRCEPHGVDTEFGEVGQSRSDAREITCAVAVAVGEAARVHLVDDGIAPPVVGAGRMRGCHVTVLSGRSGSSPPSRMRRGMVSTGRRRRLHGE